MDWNEIVINRFELAFKINCKNDRILEIDDNKNNINYSQEFNSKESLYEFIIKYITKYPNVRSVHARNKSGGTFRNITDVFNN